MQRAVGGENIAQRPKADIRVGQVVQHAGTDDLVESPAEFSDRFNREPVEFEVAQVIFLLKPARMAEAGFADVDCRHPSNGLAQRMDGGLRGPATGDQDLSICPRLLGRPQQKGERPTPIRIAVELAVPVEVGQGCGIGVRFVKCPHLVGRTGGRWHYRLFASHLRSFARSARFSSLPLNAAILSPRLPLTPALSPRAGRGNRITVTKLGQVALEEEIQEGPYHRDSAQLTDLLPAWRDRG